MLIGVVPTDRKKERWQDHIRCERDYRVAVDSGCAWLLFSDLPFSWKECEEELLTYEAKKEYVERNREDNYKASSRLDS